MKNTLPTRKKNRMEMYDYSSCGAYFITICTAKHRNFFWNSVVVKPKYASISGNSLAEYLSDLGKLVETAIKNIPTNYPSLSVDSYVIMPNHVHLLLRICSDENGRPVLSPQISRVVSHLKGYVSKQSGIPLWQKSYYDHIIRTKDDYEKHLRYIYENPVRWQSDELYFEEQ